MAAVDLADEPLHVVQAVSFRGGVHQLHHDLQRGMLGDVQVEQGNGLVKVRRLVLLLQRVVSSEQCRDILREERRHSLLHVANAPGGAKPLGIGNLLHALRSS